MKQFKITSLIFVICQMAIMHAWYDKVRRHLNMGRLFVILMYKLNHHNNRANCIVAINSPSVVISPHDNPLLLSVWELIVPNSLTCLSIVFSLCTCRKLSMMSIYIAKLLFQGSLLHLLV